MRSLFEKNLMRMKSELRDLKTAQKRGLGTIRFYSKTEQVTITPGVTTHVTAKMDPDGFFPGFMEITGGPFYGFMTVDENNLTYAVSAGGTAKTFPVTVVSTTPIQALEVS